NANKKNIPLVSPNEMVLPIINLIIIRTNRRPNKMNTNDFEGIKYISAFLFSNLDVLIKNNESIMPNINASTTSNILSRNTGKKYIQAPVPINKGGKIIFLTVAGFLEAFNRTKIIVIAIKKATIVLAIIQNIKITLSL